MHAIALQKRVLVVPRDMRLVDEVEEAIMNVI